MGWFMDLRNAKVVNKLVCELFGIDWLFISLDIIG